MFYICNIFILYTYIRFRCQRSLQMEEYLTSLSFDSYLLLRGAKEEVGRLGGRRGELEC